MKNLHISAIENDVTPPTIISYEMFDQIIEHFPLQEKAELGQTIHGHIITFFFNEGTFPLGSENNPRCLGLEDLTFLANLKIIRWVEASNGKLKIGFKNIAS